MKIEISILRILDLVDRYGSITRAAEILNKVPSGLSHNIAKIEKRFKTQLLIPEGRTVKLTPVGLTLLEDGRKLLSYLERLERKIINFESGVEEEFVLGIDININPSPMLQLMARYYQKTPKASLNLIQKPSALINGDLVSRKIQFAIGVNFDKASSNKHITTKQLFTSPLVLVVSPKYHLYMEIINLKDNITNLPWPLINWVTLQNYDSMLYPQEIRQHISLTTPVPNVDAQLKAIELGMGVGIVPECALGQYRDKLTIIAQNPNWVETYHAAWNTARMEKSLRWFILQLENIYTRTAIVSNKDIIST